MQREKVVKSTSKYESAIRKVDVKLSVRGGDRGAGPKEHLAEVTIFTLRNGVVCCSAVVSVAFQRL